MPRSLIGLLCLLATQAALGRDTGYALECIPDSGGPPQIVSFLEDGIDKRVRFLETAGRTMWDSHEWQGDRVKISSFMQVSGASAPKLVASIEIDLQTMQANFVKTADPDAVATLQCRRWSPRTRNK